MDRGMDDENGAVEDDEDDDGSDTEADDADLVDCFFDDKGIKHAWVLSKKSKFLKNLKNYFLVYQTKESEHL